VAQLTIIRARLVEPQPTSHTRTPAAVPDMAIGTATPALIVRSSTDGERIPPNSRGTLSLPSGEYRRHDPRHGRSRGSVETPTARRDEFGVRSRGRDAFRLDEDVRSDRPTTVTPSDRADLSLRHRGGRPRGRRAGPPDASSLRVGAGRAFDRRLSRERLHGDRRNDARRSSRTSSFP